MPTIETLEQGKKYVNNVSITDLEHAIAGRIVSTTEYDCEKLIETLSW